MQPVVEKQTLKKPVPFIKVYDKKNSGISSSFDFFTMGFYGNPGKCNLFCSRQWRSNIGPWQSAAFPRPCPLFSTNAFLNSVAVQGCLFAVLLMVKLTSKVNSLF